MATRDNLLKLQNKKGKIYSGIFYKDDFEIFEDNYIIDVSNKKDTDKIKAPVKFVTRTKINNKTTYQTHTFTIKPDSILKTVELIGLERNKDVLTKKEIVPKQTKTTLNSAFHDIVKQNWTLKNQAITEHGKNNITFYIYNTYIKNQIYTY